MKLMYVVRRYRGWALLRAAWWYLIRRYDSEVCQGCGRPVGLVWTAPEQMWEEMMGGPGGIRCIPCFDDAYRESHGGESLRWVPRPLQAGSDGVSA